MKTHILKFTVLGAVLIAVPAGAQTVTTTTAEAAAAVREAAQVVREAEIGRASCRERVLDHV